MNKNQKNFVALILGVLLFNFLFWDEQMGLNTIGLTLFITVVAPLVNTSRPINIQAKIMAGCIVLLTGLVIYHNSMMSKITYIASIFIYIGFLHSHELRSIPYSIMESVVNYFRWPFNYESISKSEEKKNAAMRLLRKLRLIVVPILITFIFLFIFSFANAVFQSYIENIADFIGSIFDFDISPVRALFVIWSISIIGWIVYSGKASVLAWKESQLSETIIRKKRHIIPFKSSKKTSLKNGLINENFAGIALIIMLNVLLLVINIIDVGWVWFSSEKYTSRELSQFVHQGTFFLILSVILSMLILLYLFRKNQNFYPKHKHLQTVATIWIAQNFFLLLSVGVRNYRYIDAYGLAYKRLAVFIFLIATLAGLATMYLKIKEKKTKYYLFKVNGWVVYTCFLIMSLFNWDSVILRYNLDHNKDISFIIKKAVLMEAHTLLVEKKQPSSFSLEYDKRMARKHQNYLYGMSYNIHSFCSRWGKTNWQSWNYQDSKAFDYFMEQKKEQNFPFQHNN